MAAANTQNINITATANTSGAASGIQQVTVNVRQLSEQVDKTKSAMNGLSSSVKGLLELFSIWTVYHIGKEQFSGIIEVAAQFEKLDYAMSRFMKNSQDMTETLVWVEKLGRASYGISNVEKAVVQLNAVGLKPTEAQMQGLIGYLLTIGRTGEHELAKVVGKMTELYQLGNVGLDDALKELQREVPFAMDALAHKLKINPLDLFMRDFKNRAIDFATIIKAIFEYSEEYFQGGIEDTKNFWGVLLLRWKAGVEAFRMEIGQAGIFNTFRSWIQGLIQEMDRLQAEGKLTAWAKHISDALIKLFDGMGLGKVTIEDLGKKIVKLINDISGLGPSISGAVTAIGDLGGALGSILQLYGQIPDSIKGPLGWGIVGGMLFGAYGAVILSILAAVKDFNESANKNGWGSAVDPDMMKALSASTGGLDVFYGRDSTSGNVKIQGQKIWRSKNEEGLFSYSYPNADGTIGFTSDATLAATKTKEFYQKGGEVIGEAAKEGATQYKYTVSSKIKAGGSTTPDGVLQSMTAGQPFENKMKTHYEALLRREAVAGLKEFEKDRADLWAQRFEYDEAYKKAFEHESRAAAAYWEKGEYSQSIKIMDELSKKYDEYDRVFNSALEKKKEYWQQYNADKIAKNAVDVRDINQSMADIIKKMNSVAEQTTDLSSSAMITGAKGWSDSTKAQMLEVDREFQQTVDKINHWAPDLEKMMQEVYDKLTKQGKYPTDQAWAAYEWLLKYVDDLNNLIKKAGEQAKQTAEWKKQVIGAIGTGEEESKVASLIEKYTELTGSIKDQAAAKAYVITKTEELNWLKAKSDDERGLSVEIANYEKYLLKMKQVGTEMDGLRYGLWNSSRNMTTAWETGIEMANKLKSAFDDLAGSLAELATTGKTDFHALATSVVQDLLKMMIQATITNKIFSWLGSSFGLSGVATTTSVGSTVLSTPSLTSGVDWSKYHEGGFVGWPRFHSGGLALDEVPAILQKGEYVVSKDRTGSLGATFNTQINVTAPAQSSGSSKGSDSKMNDDYGRAIATLVKAEFNKNLQEQMRPGGILNKGVNG